jgi:hypothetical protein
MFQVASSSVSGAPTAWATSVRGGGYGQPSPSGGASGAAGASRQPVSGASAARLERRDGQVGARQEARQKRPIAVMPPPSGESQPVTVARSLSPPPRVA